MLMTLQIGAELAYVSWAGVS